MDKIRENLFGISVGALTLGLLVVAWLFVLGPVFGTLSEGGGAQRDINSSLRKLKGYAKLENLPTKDLIEELEKQQRALKSALDSGNAVYDAIKGDFDRLFEGTDPSQPADFKTQYNDKLSELVSDYIDAFPRAAGMTEEEANAQGVRKSQVIAGLKISSKENISSAEDVIRAMKEYWVAKKVCDTLHALEIGGLKSLSFLGRGKTEASLKKGEELPDHYRWVESQIELDIAFDKILPFLSSLYSRATPVSEDDPENPPDPFLRPGVPFYELSNLTMTRAPGTVGRELVRQVDGEEGKPPPADPASLTPLAPEVRISLVIRALDWRGLVEDDSDESNDDED